VARVRLELDHELDGDEPEATVGSTRDVAEAPHHERADGDVAPPGRRDERHREARRNGADEQVLGAPDAFDPALELGRRGDLQRLLARNRCKRELPIEPADVDREPVCFQPGHAHNLARAHRGCIRVAPRRFAEFPQAA